MARLTSTTLLNMVNLDFINLLSGESYSSSSMSYRVQFSGWTDVYTGTGFTYKNGVPVSGTVTGIAQYDDGSSPMYVVEGLSISAASMVATARTTDTTDDDMALILNALKGSDIVIGSVDSDDLWAGAGNDLIKGNGGDDNLRSGAGKDKFIGGDGADTFFFSAVSDSTFNKETRDTIFDFSGSSGDRINLSDIDANTTVAGDQSFTFIGTAFFSGQAGELKYMRTASDTYLLADVNGDKEADFSIQFDDPMNFSSGFIWI